MGLTSVVATLDNNDSKCYNSRGMEYWCLTCNHHWTSRGASPSRQCPSCWGRAIADQDELRLGGVVALPLSSLSSGAVPPIPSPTVVLTFPLALGHFLAVMGRAHSQVERRRAAELMLAQNGVPSLQATALAAQMYP